MRTTRSLRVSDEAWAELRRRARAAGVGGRGEYLEWLVADVTQYAPVAVSGDDTEPERPAARSFEEAWERLSDDERLALKWSRLALHAFYDAVVNQGDYQ